MTTTSPPSTPSYAPCPPRRRALIDWDADDWGGHVAVSSSGVSTPHGAVQRPATDDPETL